MKVICINATTKASYLFKIKEGEVYEVIQDAFFEDTWWIPFLNQGYDKWRFVPISDIDETEIHSEYLQEVLCK